MSKRLIIKNKENLDVEVLVLFTYTREYTDQKVVVYTDSSRDEWNNLNVYAAYYTGELEDEDALYAIDDEGEWDIIQEILNEYIKGVVH